MEPVHDFSGFLPEINLGHGFIFPSYFLVTSLAFCLCVFWLVRRTDKRALSRNTGLDLALILMSFGFIGARVFHILFEEPAYYWERPFRIFEIWRGGFVWYGGAVLGTLACFSYIRARKLPLLIWLDIYAPLAALGYALGRVACLMTGCCFGDICALKEYQFRYPTQAFAVTWELSLLAVLLYMEKKRSTNGGSWLKRDGQIFFVWLALHAVGRIIMEIFRGDPRGPEPLGISISTWISAVLFLIALRLMLRNRRHPERPDQSRVGR